VRADSSFEQEPPFEYLTTPVFLFAQKTMSELPAFIEVVTEKNEIKQIIANPTLNFDE
jgi:hypothetical protein